MKYFFETIKLKNEALFYYGLICFAAGIIFFVLSKINPNPILGISGWIKPFKFCSSVALMAWTMAYYMQFLENTRQVSMYSWSLIILLSVELILIAYQASRGKISHFNRENTAGIIIFGAMGVAITIFMLHTVYIAILFFSQVKFDAPAVLILAIKLSMVIMILFAFEGFVMGAYMKHTVGANDGSTGLPIVNWSTNHGDLRVAHFLGMHALQLIPLISYVLAKTRRDVIIISAIYFVYVTYTLVQALQGKPFLHK